MSPTGISFVAIGKRGWVALEKGTKPGYYVNLKNIKKFHGEKKKKSAC
jgi:aspartate aminotransferase-like enzyme